ncbi:hypothetical protein D3C76_1451080 [compost metagenome]
MALQPLARQLTSPGIRRKYRIEVIDRNHGLEIQDFLDDTRDLEVTDTSIEKRCNRHFIGGIKHRRGTVARLGRLTRQAQAGETLLIGRLEIQASDGEQVQRGNT